MIINVVKIVSVFPNKTKNDPVVFVYFDAPVILQVILFKKPIGFNIIISYSYFPVLIFDHINFFLRIVFSAMYFIKEFIFRGILCPLNYFCLPIYQAVTNHLSKPFLRPGKDSI